MDERIDFLMLFKGTESEIVTTDTTQEPNTDQRNDMPPPPPDEHINKYLFDENLVKEICSFMNPSM
jgi:hypothetical protein